MLLIPAYVLAIDYIDGMGHPHIRSGKYRLANGSPLDSWHSVHRFLDKGLGISAVGKPGLTGSPSQACTPGDSLRKDLQSIAAGTGRSLLRCDRGTQHSGHKDSGCTECGFHFHKRSPVCIARTDLR